MGFEAVLRTVRKNIARVGWNAIFVGAGDDFPSFTYSQGFRALDHPDVLITAVAPQHAHAFLNTIYEAMKRENRRREAGVVYDDLAVGYATQFLAIHPSWVAELCGVTRRVYGTQPFTVLQLVYPDREGRWPWEDGCTLGAACPLLDRPRAEAA